MIKSLFILATGLLMSHAAVAQEFGALLGVHQTTADTDATNGLGSIGGVFNFKAGMLVNFELNDMAKFRTGLLYNQRHVDLKVSGEKVAEYQYDYFDVPALFQHNVNEMFGLFGGLVVGINVRDDAKVTNSTVVTKSGDAGTKGLIPLLQVGANVMFDDMIGFDLYYERGLGEWAENLKDFSSFGANFIYMF